MRAAYAPKHQKTPENDAVFTVFMFGKIFAQRVKIFRLPLDRRRNMCYTLHVKKKRNIRIPPCGVSRYGQNAAVAGQYSRRVVLRRNGSFPRVLFFGRRHAAAYIGRRYMANNSKDYQINDAIRISGVVRVVDGGEQLGIISVAKAKEIAYDKGLDLVLMSPNSDPPVCRIMDYGKFCYEREKKEKEAKRKQQTVEIKEVQLSCRIDTHDFETMSKRAIGFLSGGNKVKVVLRFKGREMAHQQIGRDVLARFEDCCREYGSVDKRPTLEGRQMTMMINPIKQKADKPEKQAADDAAETPVEGEAV